MKTIVWVWLLLFCGAIGCSEAPVSGVEAVPLGKGPYSVGSTNMEVMPEYADIGDEAMHEYLLGRADAARKPRFVDELLRYPESAWVTEVPVPDDNGTYGPAASLTLPVVTFLTYPSRAKEKQNSYSFPYNDARYGIFEDMLGPGEKPRFADPGDRYPLIIIAHGASAHGLYDVRHAHSLASHGFIVAVITYGDDRTGELNQRNDHVAFLRPLLTSAVLDSIIESEEFGAHIDTDNIGITGHSFGGFTALALAGGRYLGNPATVHDRRIKAGVIAAPWVGGRYDGSDFFAFGPDNSALNRVTIPVISLFSHKDEVTLASFILPAMQRLSGPTYVVELVDQPHVFEQGSWEDRDNWELLFFSAYLKNDAAALEMLKNAGSMQGGNKDVQLLDYQRNTSGD